MIKEMPNSAQSNCPYLIDYFQGMPYRCFGQSGLKGSNIGFGIWKFGYPKTGYEARVDDEKMDLDKVDTNMLVSLVEGAFIYQACDVEINLTIRIDVPKMQKNKPKGVIVYG